MNAIRALLAESIDYAGLFPPAGVDMNTAVRNYADYRLSGDAWALGRFVVPASRLQEFEAAAAPHLHQSSSSPWSLSVLAGPDLEADLATLAAFGRRQSQYRPPLRTDSLEVKATSEPAITDIMRQVPRNLETFVEVPIDKDPEMLLRSISQLGARAKVRTGGVTNDAFPSAPDLLRFIRIAVESKIPFKATAGLHHPLMADYRLTYADNSPVSRMFGFLNLFLTTAFIRSGMGDNDAARVLEEGSPEAFSMTEREIRWRDHSIDMAALCATRERGMISFGSCSFTEPISDLRELAFLPGRVQQR
jgi:hypothetical protein